MRGPAERTRDTQPMLGLRGGVPISRGLTAVVLGRRTGPIRYKLDIQCLVDADLENQLGSGWLVTSEKSKTL